MGKDNAIWLVAKFALLCFFFFSFLYPMLGLGVRAAEGILLEEFVNSIFSNSNIIQNSFFQASISTLFSLLLGVPLAFILARRDFPGKKVIRSLSLVPFVFPSILVVLSFVIVFGNNGVVNSFLQNIFHLDGPVQFLYGFFGIIIAHVFYNFPIVARLVCIQWENIDSATEQAAKTLGASRFSIFLNVTLPQLLPSIIASASLVFIYCFMSFAIVLSLGGVGFSTLEVQIYYLISRALDISSGASLALVQFVLLLPLAALYIFLSSKYSIARERGQNIMKKISLNSLQGIVEALFLLLVICFIALPLVSIIMFALLDPASGNLTLRHFEKIFSSSQSLVGTTALGAIFLSILIGFFSSIAATFFGLLASLRGSKIFGSGLILGSSVAISSITLGLGYFILYGSANLIFIILGHAVISFPFALRAIKNALGEISKDNIDAAKTLSANEFEILKYIQLPKIKGAIAASLAFAFAISLGELGFLLLLYDGVYATI